MVDAHSEDMIYCKDAGFKLIASFYKDNREIVMQIRLLGGCSRKRRMGRGGKEKEGVLLRLWEMM